VCVFNCCVEFVVQTTGKSEWEIPADAILNTKLSDDVSIGATENATDDTAGNLKSIRSIRSARSFGLKRSGSSKFTSFSEKVVMIEDQSINSNPSTHSLKTVKSALSFRFTKTPSVADNLKPTMPIKRKAKNGFQMMKESATVLRAAKDSNGTQWIEFQSADDGPIFYANDDPESGQWGRPEIFELLMSPTRQHSQRGMDYRDQKLTHSFDIFNQLFASRIALFAIGFIVGSIK
jgi:hypothetical protein